MFVIKFKKYNILWTLLNYYAERHNAIDGFKISSNMTFILDRKNAVESEQ